MGVLEIVLLSVAAAAALTGAGTSIASSISQADIAEQELALAQDQADISNHSTLTSLKTDLSTMNIQLAQYTSELSSYETALSNFDAYANLQTESAIATGKENYNTLLENYEGSVVAAAASGRTTGSAALASENELSSLESYAGEDLEFNLTGGGLFAEEYQQLVSDLAAEKSSIEDQIDVYNTAIDETNSAISELEISISDLETAIAAE